MSNNDLLKALCPEPDEWKTMPQGEFQGCVGKIMNYLLRRDQQRAVKSSAASFIGGLIGGALTWLGINLGG